MGGKPSFFYFYNYFSSKLYTSPRYPIGGRTAAKGHWSAAVRQFTIRISLNSLFKKGRCSGCIGFWWKMYRRAVWQCLRSLYNVFSSFLDSYILDNEALSQVSSNQCSWLQGRREHDWSTSSSVLFCFRTWQELFGHQGLWGECDWKKDKSSSEKVFMSVNKSWWMSDLLFDRKLKEVHMLVELNVSSCNCMQAYACKLM